MLPGEFCPDRKLKYEVQSMRYELIKRIISILLTAVFLIAFCACSKQSKRDYPIPRTSTDKTQSPVTHTEKDEEPEVFTDGYINVNIGSNSGFDLYKAPKDLPGYRYGPSFIVYENGTIDVWMASGGSGLEQWDWIVYRHYDGQSWSEEKSVLQPTPNSLDHYSCCDPGVIYLNGYYYLAYTSTLNENQGDNNLFVARSTAPDGPYEKWNGNGWGGNKPMPIRYFSEDQSLWGIGEASFVELDGTLYIYYTVKGTSGNHTMVATADAADENWPAAMVDRGYALKDTVCDAIDVKYVDKYQRFLAVGAEKRLTDDSFLALYESRDGITFTKTDACKKNVYEYCHNPGMSGSVNGHIVEGAKTFVGYAYGPEWGVWNTRFQEFTVSPADRIDLMEENASNIHVSELPRDNSDSYSLEYVGISAQSYCTVRVPRSRKSMVVNLTACKRFHNEWFNLHNLRTEVNLYGYDESVIQRTGEHSLLFNIVGTGETMVTAEFRGHITQVCVIVYEDDTKDNVTGFTPLVTDRYRIDRSNGSDYIPQIKSMLTYGDGSWKMVWDTEEYPISFSYDSTALEIDASGHIIPKKAGTYTATVSCQGYSHNITIEII